ncbi:MAG: hypothetical protein HGA35_05575 [Erysipelotrichaceae bacterium]|nr:hypothetical protein [Erysipelotrichaceae bacterium]
MTFNGYRAIPNKAKNRYFGGGDDGIQVSNCKGKIVDHILKTQLEVLNNKKDITSEEEHALKFLKILASKNESDKVDELITYTLTDNLVSSWMNKLTLPDELKTNINPKNTSILSQILDIFKSAINAIIKGNALSTVMDILNTEIVRTEIVNPVSEKKEEVKTQTFTTLQEQADQLKKEQPDPLEDIFGKPETTKEQLIKLDGKKEEIKDTIQGTEDDEALEIDPNESFNELLIKQPTDITEAKILTTNDLKNAADALRLVLITENDINEKTDQLSFDFRKDKYLMRDGKVVLNTKGEPILIKLSVKSILEGMMKKYGKGFLSNNLQTLLDNLDTLEQVFMDRLDDYKMSLNKDFKGETDTKETEDTNDENEDSDAVSKFNVSQHSNKAYEYNYRDTAN